MNRALWLGLERLIIQRYDVRYTQFTQELGVSQGSVLRPLIFKFFINHLPYHISAGNTINNENFNERKILSYFRKTSK